jgi:hypothetical protein
MKRVLVLASSLMVLLASAATDARSQVDLGWPLSTVFPIAVRFVRVDRGCDVVDKDAQAGYVVFACPDDSGKKDAPPHRGTLEFIAPDPSQSRVRVQVTLAEEPRYMELRFLELLERKIRDERGPAPPVRHPEPPTDAGIR